MNGGPTVVLPFLDNVDLIAAFRTIKSAWSMLCLKHETRSGLKVHPLCIAMTKRPDLGSRIRTPDKRIVLWHRAVVVQTQGFAGK
jgi:hypothetical protein